MWLGELKVWEISEIKQKEQFGIIAGNFGDISEIN